MGITKTEGFSNQINEMAEVLKVLGHPARLAIIEYLIKSPNCICNSIVDELPLAQPTISRHLSELKRVNLIKGTIEGKNICYCLNSDRLNFIIDYFKSIKISLDRNSNCC